MTPNMTETTVACLTFNQMATFEGLPTPNVQPTTGSGLVSTLPWHSYQESAKLLASETQLALSP